jgi:RimJ/RimL family protein N-acetyltransferase
MIATDRLILRPWEERDRAPFAAMGADPEVMATLGPLLSQAESDALVDRLIAMQARDGHCLWAVERRADGAFLGFAGPKVGDVGPIVGDMELGWRLARHAWGAGYATEAAGAAADWCRAHRPAHRIVAITAAVNARSRAVMERLGMIHRPELDFDHPKVPADSPLHRHVTYVLERQER